MALKTVANDIANLPIPDHLDDFNLDVPAVRADDPWVGYPIGIQFVCTTDSADRGNVWYIDNVRLQSQYAPRFTYIRLPGRIRITASARADFDYELQSSSDLIQWQDGWTSSRAFSNERDISGNKRQNR